MKILKHGSPKFKEAPPRHFVCPNCGCEFIANGDECALWNAKYLGYHGHGQIIETQCPECREMVQGESVLAMGDDGHTVVEKWSNGEPVIQNSEKEN